MQCGRTAVTLRHSAHWADQPQLPNKAISARLSLYLCLIIVHTPYPTYPQKLFKHPFACLLASLKMGRPLFSTSYSTPVVRTEPEPAPPTIPFEKWTHWNAFDPDSDEFFESPDAVYEAFL